MKNNSTFSLILKALLFVYFLFALCVTVNHYATFFVHRKTVPTFLHLQFISTSEDFDYERIGNDDIIIFNKITEKKKQKLNNGDLVLYNRNGHIQVGFISNKTDTAYEISSVENYDSAIQTVVTIQKSDVISVWKGNALCGWKPFHDFFWSDAGFLVFVCIPTGFLFIYSLVQFIITYKAIKTAENEEGDDGK